MISAISSVLRCAECGAKYEPGVLYRCGKCGGLLDVDHDWEKIAEIVSKELFDRRLGAIKPPYSSGVWRFKELIHPMVDERLIVTMASMGKSEGNGPIYRTRRLDRWVGLRGTLYLKHEGKNPTGSFKDYGMTVGVTEARRQRKGTVTCASTGNTASSLAAYAAEAEMRCVVFVPKGMIAYGKLSQAIAYGARVIEIEGTFDDALEVVQKCVDKLDFYLLNSINPWRLEGQKAIIFTMLQMLDWKVPDWVILPGGNLGNSSAFGKAFRELEELDFIDRLPRLGVIQASGARPFHMTWKSGSEELIEVKRPRTIASAIRIGKPANWRKALRSLEWCGGLVEHVSDEEILNAKAMIDRCGVGCEPSSAASVAGLKKLVERGAVDPSEVVVCLLTGDILKDAETTIQYHLRRLEGIEPSYANEPVVARPTLKDVLRILEQCHEYM